MICWKKVDMCQSIAVAIDVNWNSQPNQIMTLNQF